MRALLCCSLSLLSSYQLSPFPRFSGTLSPYWLLKFSSAKFLSAPIDLGVLDVIFVLNLDANFIEYLYSETLERIIMYFGNFGWIGDQIRLNKNVCCFFYLGFGGDTMRPNTRNKNKRQRPSDAADSYSQILRFIFFFDSNNWYEKVNRHLNWN